MTRRSPAFYYRRSGDCRRFVDAGYHRGKNAGDLEVPAAADERRHFYNKTILFYKKTFYESLYHEYDKLKTKKMEKAIETMEETISTFLPNSNEPSSFKKFEG